MRNVFIFIILAGLLSLPLMAQNYEKVEVFGGYQFLHLGGSGTDVNANGWDASVTANINKWFGVTGDFSGGYKSIDGVSASVYSYAGGPVFSYRSASRFTPFAHVLIGGAHVGG